MNKKCMIAGLMLGLSLGLTVTTSVKAQVSAIKTDAVTGGSLIGRWDITVNENGTNQPSWLEVELSGFKTLVGRFVSTGGSARPISRVNFDNGKFNFSIPPQWEKEDKDLVLEGSLTATGIGGTIHTSGGQNFAFTGVKAPDLKRSAAPVWGKPVKLFNGKDLTGWKALG